MRKFVRRQRENTKISVFGHNIATKCAASAVAIMPHLGYNNSMPLSGLLWRKKAAGIKAERAIGMDFLLILLMLFLGITGGYLFLIAPSIRRKKKSIPPDFFRPYAHRGLHDEKCGVMENSLPAFRRAAEKGYGIELDVHLTMDGHLIVHHDHSLLRLCGRDRQISRMTLAQIQSYRLGNTDEKIPTLDEVLSLVDGRVPLILELKSTRFGDTALAETAFRRMQAYRGQWCVESFDPVLVRWYKRHAPGIIRGQLAYDPGKLKDERKKKSLIHFLSAHLLCNFLSRPDFVAYGHETDKNLSFRVMRSLFRPCLAAWTVRSLEDFKRLQSQYDWQIFEAFEP